jgi:hypothetical protein
MAFPNAAENERVEEIREGLAQYTGTVVTAGTDAEAAASALEQLAAAEKQESFVQSFAYTTGVGYGVLLDRVSPGWRRSVRSSSDLGQMVMAAKPGSLGEGSAAAPRYGGAELRAAEEQRDAQRKALVADLERRFVDGPVLAVPAGGSGTFDIRGAASIPGIGTVYFSNFSVKAEWGTLEATKGVLVRVDGTRRLPGPLGADGETLSGDGWRVTVAPGWVVKAGPRAGDHQLVRSTAESPQGARRR